MPYSFPADDLDRDDGLLVLLGSFWSDTFEARDQLQSFLRGTAMLAKQTRQQMTEAIDSVSRQRSPVNATRLWAPVLLSEGDRQTTELTGETYDGKKRYGQSLRYGDTRELFRFRLPEEARALPLLCNRTQDTTLLLVESQDYICDYVNHAITFFADPFLTGSVARRDTATGAELLLWAFRGQYDEDLVYTHIGYPLRLPVTSTANTKQLANSVWDGIGRGGTLQRVRQLLNAVADVPTVVGRETVVDVCHDATSLLVITDRAAYRHAATCLPLVSADDVVDSGSELVDAVRIFEFGAGTVDSSIRALSLPVGFLPPGFYDSLTFRNTTVPLVVDTTDVFTRVSFEIGGWPFDVERFWDMVHEQGVRNGMTLAHLWDERTNKVGEPTAANLPATINPLQFLANYVLRNNAFAIVLQPQKFGPNALPLSWLDNLRRFVPPHTGYLILTQHTIEEELWPHSDVVADPGCEEELVPYSGSRIDEEISPDDVEETVIMKYLSSPCK